MSAPDFTTQMLSALSGIPLGPSNPQAVKVVFDKLLELILTTYYGTITNDDAGVGMMGEYITANASAVSLVSSTPKNIVSISLTAGDWEVTGWGGMDGASGSVWTRIALSASTVSNTHSTTDVIGLASLGGMQLDANRNYIALPATRFSLAATTTIYLVLTSAHTGTVTGRGKINARRMR